MKKFLKVVLSSLGLLFVVFSLGFKGNAATTSVVKDGITYNKVTSQADITDGNYLIAYEANFMGENSGDIYQRVDSTNFSDLSAAVVFNITLNGDSYKIQNTNTNLFVEYHGTSNKVYEQETGGINWNISFNSNQVFVENVSVPGRMLQYNHNNNQERFACYKGTMKNLDLYKAEGGEPVEKVNVTLMDGDSVLNTIEVNKGSNLRGVTESKPGYDFVGWFKDKELTIAWNYDTDTVTEELTLYAKFVLEKYSLVTAGTEVNSGYYALTNNVNKDNFLGTLNSSNKFAYTNEASAKEVKIQKIVGTSQYVLSIDGQYVGARDASTFVMSAEVLNDNYKWTINVTASNVEIKNLGNSKIISAFDGGSVFNLYTKANNATLFTINGKEEVEDYVSTPENAKAFIESTTKSSLKVVYDIDTQTATDVDLRFGSLMSASTYVEGAKYGVIVMPKGELSFTAGLQTVATAAEFVAANTSCHYLEATNIARVNAAGVEDEAGEYYQFAWVITNMEDHYQDNLVAVSYMEYEGKLYFNVSKEASVASVAETYVTEGIVADEVLVNVLKKLYE